jgi:hypothetical protein
MKWSLRTENISFRNYFRRDRGWLLVPRCTMFRTHSAEILVSDEGETQITFE